MGAQNPWIVENIEAFNFYCCPECDFQSKDRDYFKRHAVESHKKSKVFFLMSKSENNTNYDFMEVEKEHEYQDENEEGIKNFKESETRVKEESILESEGEKTVILSEHIAKEFINKPDNLTQEDLETFDESSEFVEYNLKTFDDKGLEDNVKELETFDGTYENITDAETSDGETFVGIGEELETLDESYIEISNTFNKENFDLSRKVEISDRELEQDLNTESEANILKAKSFDEDKYSNIRKEINSIIKGVKKRKRDIDVEKKKKKKKFRAIPDRYSGGEEDPFENENQKIQDHFTKIGKNKNESSVRTDTKLSFGNFGTEISTNKMYSLLELVRKEDLPAALPNGNKSNTTFFVKRKNFEQGPGSVIDDKAPYTGGYGSHVYAHQVRGGRFEKVHNMRISTKEKKFTFKEKGIVKECDPNWIVSWESHCKRVRENSELKRSVTVFVTKNPDFLWLNNICVVQYTGIDNDAESNERPHGNSIHKDDPYRRGKTVHEKKKEHKCEMCDCKFALKNALTNHIKTIHEKQNLKNHKKEAHMKMKAFKCKDCSMTFPTKYHMGNHHKKVHLLIKPPQRYTCHECGASFEKKQQIESHINSVHLNERPYQCNLCEKSFFIDSQLKIHMKRTHKEERK